MYRRNAGVGSMFGRCLWDGGVGCMERGESLGRGASWTAQSSAVGGVLSQPAVGLV